MNNARRKPNIVVFFTDQQRWDTCGIHGNPLGLTPNFDRIAIEGTHVRDSFTCQPVCVPARSCLQTGLYASQTGVYRNGIPLNKDSRTLAHYFKDAGYTTGYIGKWHLNKHEPAPEEERGGYEYWLAPNIVNSSTDAYNTVLYDNDCEPVRLPGYRVDAVTDAAIRYIDKHQEEPFFLFVSYNEPHNQGYRDNYPAPDGYEQRYTGRWTPPDLAALGGTSAQHLGGYYGMVKRLDEAFGRMLDALKSLDLMKDTIVMFTSDHGCHFRTRNQEYKRSCHESSIRVPTALYGPGFFGGGQVQELVSLIDLPPTLLDAAGIEVPVCMQGRSIMPLIRKQHVEWPREVFVQISESQIGRAIRTKRWKYSVSAPEHIMQNPRDTAASDLYVEEFLYDLHADPYELKNLIGIKSFEKVTLELRQRLLARMAETGENIPVIEPAKSHPGGQRKPFLSDMYVKELE